MYYFVVSFCLHGKIQAEKIRSLTDITPVLKTTRVKLLQKSTIQPKIIAEELMFSIS